MRKLLSLSGGLTGLLLLAGCASIPPLQHDQTLHLDADEGVAAIIVDTSQPLTRFWLHSTRHFGPPLKIRAVPSGKTLYLFRVEAGRYCVDGFTYGKMAYTGGASCFSVQARQIGYGGTLIPLFENAHKFQLRSVYNVKQFRRLLKQDYPQVAAQLLPGFVPAEDQASIAPNASVQKPVHAKRSCGRYQSTCSWIKSVSNGAAEEIVIRNNSVFPIWIWTVRLYACVNVNRDCDGFVFNVKLPAKTARPFLLVKPRDPSRDFSYQFHYVWHREAAKEITKKP
ncbi:MAG TPA: hypothetical protein VFK24_02760 [Gammaproteobacteria bacterium]|nr:hypothetical protein [Gammaproteobacteria bacterium]